MLFAPEVGWALLQKSGGPFLLVFRGAADPKQRSFQEHTLLQGHVHALVHRFHAVLDRQRRHTDDLLRNLFSARDQPVYSYDFIHQPDAVRLLRGNHFSREQDLHGQPRAYKPRKALRAAIAGNNAELDLRLAELGIFAGQAHGAGHGNFTSAAEGKAIDAGDYRLAEVLNQVERGLALVRVCLGFYRIVLRELVDVGAGDERLLARTGENDDTNLLILFQFAKHLPQLLHGGHVEGVQHLGPVNSNVGDGVLLFQVHINEIHKETFRRR